MVQLIFMLVVIRLILQNYKPPIQQSIQAFICVVIGVIISMIIEPNIYNFMNGIIASGVAFYGGIYLNELRMIKNKDDEK